MGRVLPWLLVAILGVVYLGSALSPHTALFHDDGIYLATAESLANHHGYRIASLPDEPYQTKYPPLYPALLALLWRWPGSFKLLSAGFTAVWAWAVYALGRRSGLDPSRAAWVVAAALCGRWALFVFTAALPDALFCALSTVALIHLMRAGTGLRWWLWPAIAGVECGAAFLARTVGATLIAAAAIHFGWRRRFRELALFTAVAATFCTPWILWQRGQTAPDDPALAYYTKASYQQGSLLSQTGLERKGTVLGLNLVMLAAGFPVLLNGQAPWGTFVMAAMILCALLPEALARLRQGSIPALWLAISIVVLALWVGPPFRYMLPLLPLVGIFVCLRMERRIQVVLAILVVLAAGATVAGAAGSLCLSRPVSWTNAELDDPAASDRLFDWIRRSAVTGAVIAANNDPLAYRKTGHKAIRPFASDNYELLYAHRGGGAGTAHDFIGLIHRHQVRYLVLTPMLGFHEGAPFHAILSEVRQRFPERLAVRYQEPDSRYAILEVR